jgi:KDO2-lipid IV(A) lauroyltransferase
MKMREHLAPRHWPTRILLSIMRLAARLPLPWLLGLGKTIGAVIYRLLPARRRIARINIDLCFPEKTEAERRALCKATFHNVGRAVMETALAWWGPDERLKRLYQIEGLNYLEQARLSGRPVLLLSGHMSCTEIGGRLLAFHTNFQAMYKPAKNKLFDAVMLQQRKRFYYDMVSRKQSRTLLRNLKNGVNTWYAPDQNFGREDTVFAPFFGVPATTLTATSRIAAFADATVIPFFPYRLPDNRGYRLVLGPPLKGFPGESIETDARRVNAVIEAAVRTAPEQYLWVHKRFRLRPPGEAPVY